MSELESKKKKKKKMIWKLKFLMLTPRIIFRKHKHFFSLKPQNLGNVYILN